MADSRTFTLIGEFKDGITPELAKINRQLATLKESFSGIGSRKNTGFRGATNDIGKLVSAHKNLSSSIKEVKGDLGSTIGVLQQYRREMGKAAAATRSFQKSGGSLGGAAFAQNMRHANSEAQAYLRTLQQINRQSARPLRTPPGGGAAGGAGGLRGPGGPGGGGGYAAAVGGGILGSQLANTIQGAIVSGFNIGTQLMYKPFEYFRSRFGERIKDEMDDLKAAGGFYSIAKRQKDPFVKTMDDAIQFQQDNNRVFANMAASLPGVTNDYVQASKRIGDTVARVVGNDLPKAIAEANKIRATEEGRKFYGGEIRGTGPEAVKQTMTTLIGDLTKQTVLAGLGGRTGAGGMMGAYGLPGLAERMISQEQVSMGQFQRYAAIFGDPMIADAMARNIDKLNATQKNSMDRMNALRAMFAEILTPELIDKLRTSFDGVYQGLYSSILDPDKGLFGLGRQMQGLGKRINSFGQYVDKLGNVVPDVKQAADMDLSIFEMLRDIFVNTGQVLSPIVEFMPQIWDPLKNIAKMLKDARHYTAEFARTFNEYREGLKAYAKGLGGAGGDKILQSLDLRASFAAINNLFAEFGVYGKDTEKMFGDLAAKIKDPSANLGAIAKDLLDKFFTSDIAENIGEFLGNLIGTILKQVGDATKFVAGIAEGGGFAGGFASAFSKAGGFTAIQDIFMSIVQLFIKALITAVTKMPALAGTVAVLAIIPSIIGAAVTGMVERMMDRCSGMMGGACPMPGGGRGGRGGRAGKGMTPGGGGYGDYQGRPRRYGPGGSMDRLNRMRRYKMGQVGKFGVEAAGLGYNLAGRPGSQMAKSLGGMAKGAGRMARAVPGGAVAAGAIDLASSVASGENFGKAAVGAFGTVLGGAAGSIFGPVGTVIGSIAGGMLADAASDFVVGAMDQNKAALMQIEAAQKQVAAASEAAVAKYGPEFGEKLGGVEALNRAMGGGAGIKAYADEQLRLGKILPEQAQQWEIFGKDLTAVNSTTKKVQDAQKKYETAVKLNTGEQAKYKQMLERAKAEQEAALKRVTSNWEAMSSASRTKLLSGADGIVAALNEAAAKIRGWKGIPGLTPAPPPRAPASTARGTEAPPDRKGKPAPTGLDSRKLIPGLPATPESGYGAAKGRLGDAIASEMKQKPSGSSLVIANSSETVIPAAGGNGGGMVAFVETLRAGFDAVVGTYRQTSQQAQTHLTTQMTALGVTFKTAQERQRAEIAKISQTLVINQQQTNAKLSALEKKFNAPAMPGGLGGGAAGGVDAFTPIASRMGLQLTSGYRPGDPGWHGANRARDYSNGTGPTPQMMQFAQYMAATYGSNLKELIYTPLGFSIKNGQRVAPYAQGAHYNHVHVAYAMGLGNGVAFSSLQGAEAWERSMVPGSVKVGSVTANSSEGFGGATTVTNNITINQQPGQDADELASIVAMKIGEAVADARAASIFV